MTTETTEMPTDEEIAEIVNMLLADSPASRYVRTGIRAAVATLIGAGYLTGNAAIAYATSYGASELDTTLVLALGSYRLQDPAVMATMCAAVDSDEGGAAQDQLIVDLTTALHWAEEEFADASGTDGNSDSGPSAGGAAPGPATSE